ncbi:MAG: FHA domain-containing protein [Kribbellaceae bacterium]|nr:FHA domain-containing protein [Kribbellaceae bacterium]
MRADDHGVGNYLIGPGSEFRPLPDQGLVTIGRDPDRDLRLAGDDQVSRRHADLWHTSGHWVVVDHSTNGTYVNGLRITERSLSDGDQLRFGGTTYTFHADSSGSRESTVIAAPVQAPRPARGIGGKMAVTAVLEVLHLGLNALLTFVTDLASGPLRWIISQAAVVVIAMVMAGAGTVAERAPADTSAGPSRQRTGRSSLVVVLTVLLVLGGGGFAATAAIRYGVNYVTGKEPGTDRLSSQVTKNAAGLTLTVGKVESTRHFTRVELTVQNNTRATSIDLPVYGFAVLSSADGTTLRGDPSRSQWTETVPPGAFQRGTITFPGHLPSAATKASFSFSQIFGTLKGGAITVTGLRLKALG